VKTKNNNRNNIKTYCFDLDGVICKTKKNYYYKSMPIKKAINKINSIYLKGNKVIIFTSRYMGRSNENVNLAKKRGYNFTFKQLKKWKIKFHKLIFGKPSYDFIIDDKAVVFKNWVINIK
jgi:histidinol phosphatase-like enzyme